MASISNYFTTITAITADSTSDSKFGNDLHPDALRAALDDPLNNTVTLQLDEATGDYVFLKPSGDDPSQLVPLTVPEDFPPAVLARKKPGQPDVSWYDTFTALAISPTFTLNVNPARFALVDIDEDQDLDAIVEFENGIIGVSYNLQAQFETTISGDGTLTPPEWSLEQSFWTETLFAGIAQCANSTYTQGLLFAEAGIYGIRVLSEEAFEQAVSWDNPEGLSPEELHGQIARAFESYLTNVQSILQAAPFEHALSSNKCLTPYAASYALLEMELERYERDLKIASETLAMVGHADHGIGIGYNPSTVFQGYIEVVQVNSDSPAERSGLQVGDKITEIDGMLVGELQQYPDNPNITPEKMPELFDEDGNFNEETYMTFLDYWPDYFFLRSMSGPAGTAVFVTYERTESDGTVSTRTSKVARTRHLLPGIYNQKLTKFY